MEKLKQNRTLSFIIIFIVYILSSAVGFVVYDTLSYPWWLSLLIADITATAVTFVFSCIFKNASVYDPYWSVQPVVILAFYALGTELNLMRILLLIAVFLWGIRLTANWAYTFPNLQHQDWRYTMYEKKTGKLYPIVNFTGIHLMPTLIVYLCVLPAAYAFINERQWNIGSIIFFCLSIFAMTIQGLADMQMHRFRKNRTSTFIRVGLWKHSRHPNYLGEILMWWGIALSVISVFPQVWYLCLGAAANTLLLLCVSIPLADGKQSGKVGFEEYKKGTRILLPLAKRKI